MNSNTDSTQGIFLRCSSNVWMKSSIRKCKGYIRLAFGKNHQIDTHLSLIFSNWPAVPHHSNCPSPPTNPSQCSGAPSDWLGPLSLPCPGLPAFSWSLDFAFDIFCHTKLLNCNLVEIFCFLWSVFYVFKILLLIQMPKLYSIFCLKVL